MRRVLEQIEAHYQEKEVTGRGITVAVLDSGFGRHPDLAGNILCFKDFVNNRRTVYDDNGHGTHVCGIICGKGSLSSGWYRGIAPDAELVVCKVLDKMGDGTAEHMLEGLKWVQENKERYRIRVLNISVGIGELKDKKKEEDLRHNIEELWDCGITVICAAGNKGPENESISAIGGSDKVITVGCHDGKHCLDNPGRCATYSGRGNALSPIRKPDIVAPGTDIMSCNVFCKQNYGCVNHAYVKKSGTSMATPIISGAAALTFSKYPDMTNEEFKQKLTYTATDLGEAWNMQGWGMVNVRRLLSE
uniref:S8 family peptidase n=1 Tax=Acetatifactor sp. TaxID=1872090 RepID=UPI0040563459